MTARTAPGDPPISATRRRRPSDGARDPERTRRNLLDAAYREFATHGYHGASVEKICRRAGVSKQILSYHFGSKANVYLTVIERAYAAQRAADPVLDVSAADPVTALRSFVGLSFDYLMKNRDFVSLLADENINKGRHVRKSTKLQSIYTPLVANLEAVLRAGETSGVFRPGVDPLQLYISISGLCYFFFSNIHTLSAAFGVDLITPAAMAARREHVLDFVMAAVARPLDREPATRAPVATAP